MRKRRLRNIHPGEVLAAEFLVPMRISRYRLGRDIGVPATRIAEICAGRRAVTADTAVRLARYFGTTPKFWLGLQADFDLEEHARAHPGALESIRPLDAGA